MNTNPTGPQNTQDDIASAILKMESERQKALDEARAIICRNDRDELLFLMIHQSHLMKVILTTRSEDLDSGTKAMCRASADAYAYSIQLIYKYGSSQKGVLIEDFCRLLHISLFVNHGFEMETFLRYLPFERVGERLQNFRIYLKGMTADKTRTRMFEYGARHELDGSLSESDRIPIEKLIEDLFPKEMDSEFVTAFGLTTEEVKHFYSELIGDVRTKLLKAEGNMKKVGDRVDVAHFDSFRAARLAYTIEYEPFLSRFGNRKSAFRDFLLKLALQKDQIDEFELRHFKIWREHILPLDGDHFTQSPEISVLSPHFGLHYTLLENPLTKDSYQAKRAQQFQNRIENMLSSLGFRIVTKNLDTRSGKRDLGDVDLLAEDSKNYFNIECKGAVLPLRVYFHDYDYILNIHLPNLRDKKAWDKKTVTREAWLNERRNKLGLSQTKPLLSVVISESPEVISHFSSTLCLSRQEFPLWYARTKELDRFVDFEEFQKDVLRPRMIKLTKEQNEEMENMFGMGFEREDL